MEAPLQMMVDGSIEWLACVTRRSRKSGGGVLRSLPVFMVGRLRATGAALVVSLSPGSFSAMIILIRYPSIYAMIECLGGKIGRCK
jgi:hypothetical protein